MDHKIEWREFHGDGLAKKAKIQITQAMAAGNELFWTTNYPGEKGQYKRLNIRNGPSRSPESRWLVRWNVTDKQFEMYPETRRAIEDLARIRYGS